MKKMIILIILLMSTGLSYGQERLPVTERFVGSIEVNENEPAFSVSCLRIRGEVNGKLVVGIHGINPSDFKHVWVSTNHTPRTRIDVEISSIDQKFIYFVHDLDVLMHKKTRIIAIQIGLDQYVFPLEDFNDKLETLLKTSVCKINK